MIDQAPEIEESVLGACLLDVEAYHIVMEKTTDDFFYLERNKVIYRALKKRGGDLLGIEDQIRDWGKMDFVGNNYLIDLTRTASVNVEYHCQILLEKHLKRKITQECRNILSRADESDDVYQLIDELNRRVNDIDSGVKQRTALTPTEIQERDKDKPIAEKLYLGLSDLDYGIYSDSMRRGQVELTIADSGHGKTQFALFKVESLLRHGYKVAWFQLEGYDSETAAYFDHLANKDNLYITHSLYDIEDIKREGRMLKREFGLDYAVFDYVQNIECSKDSRSGQVEYISQQITRMAKDLNIYCHPLSQVTMSYSTRHGWSQEPGYGDVRWSQQLKQDAHIITSVFRPSRIESLVLNPDTVKDWNDNQIPYNSVFVKQAKVRHGVQEWKRLHMIHTEKGLKPYTKHELNGAPF
jgi:replicative DNA helicase